MASPIAAAAASSEAHSGRVTTVDERALHEEARQRGAAIVSRAGLEQADVPVTTALYD